MVLGRPKVRLPYHKRYQKVALTKYLEFVLRSKGWVVRSSYWMLLITAIISIYLPSQVDLVGRWSSDQTDLQRIIGSATLGSSDHRRIIGAKITAAVLRIIGSSARRTIGSCSADHGSSDRRSERIFGLTDQWAWDLRIIGSLKEHICNHLRFVAFLESFSSCIFLLSYLLCFSAFSSV